MYANHYDIYRSYTDPISRVAQSCRSAAIEMPRPTIRKWCEYGYNQAFSKTKTDLSTHFKSTDSITTAETVNTESEPIKNEEEIVEPVVEKIPVVAGEVPVVAEDFTGRDIILSLPINIEDADFQLDVYEGQNAEGNAT